MLPSFKGSSVLSIKLANMPDYSTLQREWSKITTDDLYDLLKLRTDVFFLEQNIEETELDGRDREPETRHYWIADDHGTAAYLRTLVDPVPEHRDAHLLISRVVVRADRRGEGLAQKLLEAVLERHADEPLLLHAQEYIAPLYARYGFEPFGEVYQEAGISHLSMYRPAGAALAT
jgi:ElaA protein